MTTMIGIRGVGFQIAEKIQCKQHPILTRLLVKSIIFGSHFDGPPELFPVRFCVDLFQRNTVLLAPEIGQRVALVM